jgi:hypothetical protein
VAGSSPATNRALIESALDFAADKRCRRDDAFGEEVPGRADDGFELDGLVRRLVIRGLAGGRRTLRPWAKPK